MLLPEASPPWSFWHWGGSQTPAASTPVGAVVPYSAPPLPFDPSSIVPSGWFRYGFPGPVHDLRHHAEFISCYDRLRRIPVWVVEHITKALLAARLGDRKNSVFREDEAIPERYRARLRDYFRLGYDRGHNAPAADARFSQPAMDETFFLTNMAPQVGEGFNRDYWAHLEDLCRRLTARYDSVRVLTGSLFLPQQAADGKWYVRHEMIGSPPTIAVPTHFYKVVVGETTGRSDVAVAAFVLPNARIDNATPLTSFQVPLEAVEQSSGLELLPKATTRDLCREAKCEIVVREFARKALPPKQ